MPPLQPEPESVVPPRSWFQIGVVLAAVVVGFAIRTAGTESHSFWYDEAMTAELSHASYSDLLTGRSADNGNPPFYWLMARSTGELFGRSEKAMRLFSVICGVMTIFVVSEIGRRVFSPAAGLAAAIIWAISPYSLELSTEARAYALLHLLVAANTLFFVNWLRSTTSNVRASWVNRAGYVLTMSAMCLTHYFGVLVPISHFAALVVQRVRWKSIGDWFAQSSTAASLSMFWLPVFLFQMGAQDNVSRFSDLWKTQLFATPLVFSLGRTFAWRDSDQLLLIVATALVLLLFWLPAVWGSWNAIQRDRRSVAVVLTFALPLTTPLIFSLILGSPVFHIRAASVVLPVFVVLIAIGFVCIPRHFQIAGTICCAILVSTSISGFFSEHLKDDWRSITPLLVDELNTDEALVFDTEIQVRSFKYYAKRYDCFPSSMYGLIDEPRQRNQLMGVRWVDGRQVDEEGIDCTREIIKRDSFWLITCNPYSEIEAYEAFFDNFGFQPVEHLKSYRIEMVKFQREQLAVVAAHTDQIEK